MPKLGKLITKKHHSNLRRNNEGAKLASMPHYMRLRPQDVQNKMESKQKIREIKRTHNHQITRSPGQKWMAPKITPVNAALNAKFYKHKPKPSIDRHMSDNEKSKSKFKKVKNISRNDFDRSESHCRR